MLNYFVLVMAAGHLLKEILSLFSQVRRNSPPYIAYYNLQGNNYNIAEIFEFLSSIHRVRKARGTGAEMCPQLFLGWLLGTRQSAIGQFFPLSLATFPQVFAKFNSVQFLSRF